MSTRALWLQLAAFWASLSHALIDYFIGLYGRGEFMSLAQAGTATFLAAVYGAWAWALSGARQGGRAALSILLLMSLWTALGYGIGGLVLCSPPCAPAVPYHDFTHLGSLVLGALAAATAWRALRSAGGPLERRSLALAVAVVLGFALLQTVTLERSLVPLLR